MTTGIRPTSSGNKPKAHQIVRLHKAQKILAVFLRLLAQLCAKAQRRVIRALLDMLFKAIEGTAADKQDIFCVYLNKLLLWVLAAAVGRHVAHRSLQYLQKRLLNALAAHVACDGGVFRFCV